MDEKLYYLKYEDRYQKAYAAGAEHWGHFSDDVELIEILTKWVDEHNLRGKKIIEFACGEGASGVILSRLGCIYHGIDIAPSAVEKAKNELHNYPNASAEVLDMVNQKVNGHYDAALDVMGLHMLVTDDDRHKYLRHVFDSLSEGSPILFFRESFSAEWVERNVGSFSEWKSISGSDYDTPEQRFVEHGNAKVEVLVPLVPARAKNKEGYFAEMNEAGFVVDEFNEMATSNKISLSASIYAHKP